PKYEPNPSISLFYICETEKELQRAWDGLAKGSKTLYPLDKYPWAEKYGWISDRYGVSWQIALGKLSDVGQKITPCLTFAGASYGRAAEAVKYYASVFKNSGTNGIRFDEKDKRLVKHAQVSWLGQKFMLMDSE